MILPKNKILEELSKYNYWVYDGKYLTKQFSFSNFVEAISFVVKIGFIAENLNHHPDIKLHSWNKVDISTYTHSVNGITEKDFELLQKIEN